MTLAEQDRQSVPGLDTAERDRVVTALETRFAPHLDAAAAAVREAERELAEARERLAKAEEAAATGEYRSDPLVFMRETLSEDVDALERRTNPKKVRAAFRFLLDRAVDLAAGEVQGFHDDQAAAEHERLHGVEACRLAVQRAAAALEEARAMAERVRSAERAARRGLDVMLDKLAAPRE